jgi:hypothetical protein
MTGAPPSSREAAGSAPLVAPALVARRRRNRPPSLMAVRSRFSTALLLCAACSDSHANEPPDASPDGGVVSRPDGGDDAGEVPRLTLAEFEARRRDASCRITAACGTPERELYLDLLALPDADCSELVDFGAVLEPVPSRVSFDEVAAAACLEALEGDFECFEAVPACDAVYRGLVANGDGCDHSFECASGRCDYDGDTCTSACAPRFAVGEACDAHEECASGVCEDERCAPEPAFERASEGEPCELPARCEPGLYCIDRGSGPRCVREPALGEACDPSHFPLCEPPYVCDGVCAEPPAVQDREGEACGPRRRCNRLLGLDCRGGVCTSIGDGSAGSECRSDLPRDCDAGLVCHRDACTAPIPVGERCDPAVAPCVEGAWCPEGACVELPSSCP